MISMIHSNTCVLEGLTNDHHVAQLTNIPRDALLAAGAHVTFHTTVEAVEWLQQRLAPAAAM